MELKIGAVIFFSIFFSDSMQFRDVIDMSHGGSERTKSTMLSS